MKPRSKKLITVTFDPEKFVTDLEGFAWPGPDFYEDGPLKGQDMNVPVDVILTKLKVFYIPRVQRAFRRLGKTIDFKQDGRILKVVKGGKGVRK